MVGLSFVFHTLGEESLDSLNSLENRHFWKDPFSKRPLFPNPIILVPTAPENSPERRQELVKTNSREYHVTVPALEKHFVNIFRVCLGILHWKKAGIFGEFFWSPFPTKRSTKTPRKIRGKFGAKFGAKFGTKIRKIRGTFVLQLCWPNTMSDPSDPKFMRYALLSLALQRHGRSQSSLSDMTPLLRPTGLLQRSEMTGPRIPTKDCKKHPTLDPPENTP